MIEGNNLKIEWIIANWGAEAWSLKSPTGVPFLSLSLPLCMSVYPITFNWSLEIALAESFIEYGHHVCNGLFVFILALLPLLFLYFFFNRIFFSL